MNINQIVETIGNARLLNPEGLSVYVDVGLIYEKDPEVGKALTYSVAEFYKIEEELRKVISAHTGHNERYRLRLHTLPNSVKMAELTHSAYENKMVQFKALVTQIVPVRKLMSRKAYRCRYCNGERAGRYAPTLDMMLTQSRKRMVYTKCHRCNKDTPQDIISESCVFVPVQKVQLLETLDETQSGRPPIKIAGYLLDDLAADLVRAGDQVSLVGLIHPDIKEGAISNTVYAEIISFRKTKSSYEEVELTIEDMDWCLRMKDDPEIYSKLVKSFAPTIYSHEVEKLALLCSLFSAPRIQADSTFQRGDVHILLCGDPGVSKSVMIDWATKVSPRGITAMGSRATGAGLCASWTKGKDGVVDIEPGALVLADGGGLVAIDELEKMKDTDRMSIHRPMEQQEVAIVMAGVQQVFNSRCSIIAAANPKTGRYNPEKSLLENIDLDQALLSRFDLIFIMRDIPQLATEEKLADHILKTQSGSSRHAPIEMPMLRKYIAYARRYVEPTYDPDGPVGAMLKEGYLKIRLHQTGQVIPATPRQLEGLIRLSKAMARMQLSPTVSVNHVKMALDLYAANAKPITLEVEVADRPISKYPPNEQKIWDNINKLSQTEGKIFLKKLRNMHPGREDLVDTVVQNGLNAQLLESIDTDHVKVINKP